MGIAARLMAAMFAVALLTALAIYLVVVWGLRETITPVESARQFEVLRGKSAEIAAYVAGLRADTLATLWALPRDELAHQLQTGEELGPTLSATIDRVFRARIESKISYLQIRLISAAGRERVRFERDAAGGIVRKVTAADLQDKGERPYLQRTLEQDDGQVYVSPIDLNQEHGVVQVPHVRVIRAGTPLLDSDGKVLAAVVINVDVGPALDALQSRDGRSSTYLVAGNDEFIVHPDPANTFANDLGHGHRVTKELPPIAPHLHATERWEAIEHRAGDTLIHFVGMPVSMSAYQSLQLVLAVPALGRETLTSVDHLIRNATLVGLLLSLLVAGALASGISRPIFQMVAAVRHLGKHEQSPMPTNAPGEIGVLARAMTDAGQHLREQTEALVTQRQQFHSMFDISPVAKLLVDADCKVQLANKQAGQLFGYTPDSMIGRAVNDLVPPGARERHSEHMKTYQSAPQARRMGRDMDLYALRSDGEQVPVTVGLSALNMGKEQLILAAIDDISERRHYEMALRQSNEQLSQFAYIAAHDLREPLRIVASYVELLERRYSDRLDDKGLRYISHIVGESRRMQGLIQDLLIYSRVESQGQEPQAVDTAQELAGVVQSLGPAINEAGADLQIGDLPPVKADAAQLRMVWQNLLTNALRYRSDAPLRIEVGARVTSDGWVTQHVADNGVGIAPEHAERVFQMFQRLQPKSADGGSGIGLALVKRIVERHGGRVWFESKPGAGATFYFTLRAA